MCETIWIGEGDGFRSFTRHKKIADRWAEDMKVTPVYTSSPSTAPNIAALVADLRAVRDAMPRSFSASRDIVIRAIDALLAFQSENTALQVGLEEAEKVFAKQEEIADGALSDHDKIRLILRAARRWLEGK